MHNMANNVVDILREKNDEADLDQVLKTQMGGYTKKSVQDYVTQLKRQQHRTAEAFNRDMQALLDEKEQLIAANNKLKNRISKVLADYKTLYDSVASVKSGETSVSVNDVMQLRGRIRALEKDKQDLQNQVTSVEKQSEQKQHVIGDKNRTIEQQKQEIAMYQGMLAASRNDSDQLRQTVSEQAGQLETMHGELEFLKAVVSDGNVSKLNTQIDELTINLEKMNGELDLRVKEIQAAQKQIETLKLQQENNHQANETLRQSLESVTTQNEKLEAENNLLNEELERCIQENLVAKRAHSELKVLNAILQRKLDAEKLRCLVDQNEADKK